MVAPQGSTPTNIRWSVTELTTRRSVCPTNGIRFGPGGDLFVASAYTSVIARLDVDSGRVEMASPIGDAIVSPDDLDFDSSGRMYVAECMDARVTELGPDGTTRVIAEGLPGANGITVFEDRIFVNECRPAGRFFEVYRDGKLPKLLADDIPFANGCSVGPNREIYYPRIMSGEVWRIPIEGGKSTLVASGLSGPSAVKIRDGRIYVCEGHSGEISEIFEATGSRLVLAQLRPGIDSIDLSPDGRIFASHWQDGEIVEVVDGGKPRTVLPPALIGPYGIAADSSGDLYIADGARLLLLGDDGNLTTIFRALFDAGMSGMLRGIAVGRNGALLVTSASGEAYRYNMHTGVSTVLTSGRDELMGVTEIGGRVLIAEAGAGSVLEADEEGNCRVIAAGMGRPVGLATSGAVFYVSDSEYGTVTRFDPNGVGQTIATGFSRPEGVAIMDGHLLVVDAGSRQLAAIDLVSLSLDIWATDLPVGGAPAGITKPRLNGVPEVIPGPFTPYADVAVGNGRILITGDANGTVLELRRTEQLT